MKFNKISIFVFCLFFLSYVLGFLCYLPFWTVLIISAVFQMLIWVKIAAITEKIKNTKISLCFNVLCFYKMILSIIGYIFIYVDSITPFHELNKSLVLFTFITQVKPFGLKLLNIVDNLKCLFSSFDNLGLVIQIIISGLFSAVIIFSYYITKMEIKQKSKRESFLRIEEN